MLDDKILYLFIQIELEKLNSSTDVINKLELDLEVSCKSAQVGRVVAERSHIFMGPFLPSSRYFSCSLLGG